MYAFVSLSVPCVMLSSLNRSADGDGELLRANLSIILWEPKYLASSRLSDLSMKRRRKSRACPHCQAKKKWRLWLPVWRKRGTGKNLGEISLPGEFIDYFMGTQIPRQLSAVGLVNVQIAFQSKV